MPLQLTLGLPGEGMSHPTRSEFRKLVDRHLAAIVADRAVRESAWERAQEIRQARLAGVREPLRQVRK